MGNHIGTQTVETRNSGAQQRLIDTIAELGSATTAKLVEATGFHENTVRAHLEKLHTQGQLRYRALPADGRGRPARDWSVVGEMSKTPYLGLAVTLAETLSKLEVDAAHLAREAGRAWGADLVDGHPDAGGARQLVVEVMREQGFSPAGTGDAVSLHSCPLIAAVSEHRDIVCATHAGMVEGIARAYDPSASIELEPFTAPSTCMLRFHLAS